MTACAAVSAPIYVNNVLLAAKTGTYEGNWGHVYYRHYREISSGGRLMPAVRVQTAQSR